LSNFVGLAVSIFQNSAIEASVTQFKKSQMSQVKEEIMSRLAVFENQAFIIHHP